MSFDIFDRGCIRGINNVFVTINKLGRFSFNNGATAIFNKTKCEYALLMWDKNASVVGIKPTAEFASGGYKIRRTKSGRCDFSAVTFFRHIGYDFSKTKSHRMKWSEGEGMFTFLVSSVLKDTSNDSDGHGVSTGNEQGE